MLPIGSAFLVFFSEKIPSDVLVSMCRMNTDVYPDLCASRLNDVDIRSVQRTDPARGRFAIGKSFPC